MHSLAHRAFMVGMFVATVCHSGCASAQERIVPNFGDGKLTMQSTNEDGNTTITIDLEQSVYSSERPRRWSATRVVSGETTVTNSIDCPALFEQATLFEALPDIKGSAWPDFGAEVPVVSRRLHAPNWSLEWRAFQPDGSSSQIRLGGGWTAYQHWADDTNRRLAVCWVRDRR
jgi:hypothetical protein